MKHFRQRAKSLSTKLFRSLLTTRLSLKMMRRYREKFGTRFETLRPDNPRKLKGPLLGKDGQPVIARMDEKGGGVNLTFGGVEEREKLM